MKIKNTGKQKFLKILTLTLFSFLMLQTGWSQITNSTRSTEVKHSTLCNHDFAEDIYYKNNPQEVFEREAAKERIRVALKNQESTERTTITIPIVFHVLHLGETVGSGSNISDGQILQALADLNNDFADVNGVGTDVGIQFCLAQQDPDGNNSTGINRADASGIPNFPVYGLWPGQTEIAAKALSNWPEEDYVNVWIAHRLYTGSGDAAGYAYFPSASDAVDGIALRSDATGVPANSKVITHEAGHFFWLFHTFQDATNSVCPPNANCSTDGDLICETRAHNTFPGFPFPCNEALYTNCDLGYSLGYNVTENHMNYTDNSCRDEFVPEQIARMHATLASERSGLLNSIGCSPGCPGVVASFTLSPNNTTIAEGTTVTFTSTSTGASTQSWTVDGVVQGTGTTLSFTFVDGGIYEVCLVVMDANGCASQSCVTITATPVCEPPTDPCEEVINGDFEQIIATAGGNTNDFNLVCGWDRVWSSPFFCDGPTNNALGFWFSNNTRERVTMHDPLTDFEVGDVCTVSFDYLVTLNEPIAIQIALVDNNTNPSPTGNLLPANATVIAQVNNPSLDDPGVYQNICYPDGVAWHHFETTFTYTDAANVFVTVTGIGPTSGVSICFVDNVSINCCEDTGCTPEPDFTWDGCLPTTFTGTNTGDPGDFTWNFLCDGSTDSGPVVTKNLAPGSTCEVCLTVNCDVETAVTVCHEVTIDPECEPQECLAVEIKEKFCKDQGTADPSDDYWYFSMIVTDLSGNGVYWVTTGDIIEAGPYGECKVIWPSGSTIGGTPSLTFTVCDAEDPDCCIEVTVDAPEPCSVECDLDVDLVTKCDKNKDGYFEWYVQATVTVADDETCFMIKRKNPDGSEEIIDTYYGTQTVLLGPFSPVEEFTLWFVLCEAPDYCIVDFSVQAPEGCKNCLDYYVSNITCYNNGTTTPDDDYWSFDIIVDGPNDFWVSSAPVGQSGSYNNVKTIFVSSFDDLEFVIYDNKKKCKRKVVIKAPEPCSYDCDFEFEYKVSGCKYVEGEWVFYVAIHIYSSAYECFTVKKKNSDNSEEILGNFPPNTDHVFGPFAEGEDFTLWVMACDVFDCVLDTWIDAPDCGEESESRVNDVVDFEVNIFPNPADQQLSIESTSIINTISIFNSTGELVENLTVNDLQYSKNLNQFKSGIYFMRLVNENGDTVVKKFLKVD